MDLNQVHGNWVTELGGWLMGQRVELRGKNLLEDFNDWPWLKQYLYAITGKELEDKQLQLLDRMWGLCGSYPDPRIWPNTIAALCGTARSTGALAVAAATAVAEAQVYGRGADIQAAGFLDSVYKYKCSHGDINTRIFDSIKNRAIKGWGRPVKIQDERLEPLLSYAESLGFGDGEYMSLVKEIDLVIANSRYKKSLHMNIAIIAAALAMDIGLTPREYYYYTILSYSAGVLPCYVDALAHHTGEFLPLKVDDIQYSGPKHRKWEDV